MAYFKMYMNIQATTQASMKLAQKHYENFPVASFFLPKNLRDPIALIYSFARQADDFADEGDLSAQQRLGLLNGFKAELDHIQLQQTPKTDLFIALASIIKSRNLPITPFYDLLKAFTQDVTKNRYQNFGELMTYCRLSANPIGRLLLSLYGQDSEKNIGMADAICSALQIINFLQDVAIDIDKNRIYLPQDELEHYKVTESQIMKKDGSGTWSLMMEFQINRARKLLQAGAPLGLVLPGRIGFEIRMMIAGGERILKKLHQAHGDVFHHRPILNKKDWLYMLYRAATKK